MSGASRRARARRFGSGLQAALMPNVGTNQGWWRSDLGITEVAGAVTDWADQSINFGYRSGTARDWAQVTATHEPIINTRFIGGHPALDFDGGNQHLRQNISGNGVSSSTFTHMFVLNLDNTTGSGILYDNESGRSFVQSLSSGLLRIHTGANDDVTWSIPTSPQVLIFTINGVSSQVYANGIQEDSDFTASSRAFDDEQSLFSQFSGAGATPDGLLSEVALWSPALTVAQIGTISDYAISRYSL